jgi:hypothetical protein
LISRSKVAVLLLASAAAISVVAVLLPPIPQPLSYHQFADQRSWLGIPNFGDVVSNLGFALVGVCGLVFILRSKAGDKSHFASPSERWPYFLMFAGMLLTAFGSAYYHLAPDNARLVWDRLPMTIVFMSLVAAAIAERINLRAGLFLLPLLLAIGAASVLEWRMSELHAHGDLRFYAAVQIFAIVVLLLAMLSPPKYTRGSDFAVVVGFYLLAKTLETADRQVFTLGHIVSGHTLKHLAAAAGGYWILRMLKKRVPESSRESAS